MEELGAGEEGKLLSKLSISTLLTENRNVSEVANASDRLIPQHQIYQQQINRVQTGYLVSPLYGETISSFGLRPLRTLVSPTRSHKVT